MKGCFFFCCFFFSLPQSKDPTVFFFSGFLPAVRCECCCVSDTKRDPAALQDHSVINISHLFHYLSQSFTPKKYVKPAHWLSHRISTSFSQRGRTKMYWIPFYRIHEWNKAISVLSWLQRRYGAMFVRFGPTLSFNFTFAQWRIRAPPDKHSCCGFHVILMISSWRC